MIANNKYTLDRQICEWFGAPDRGLFCSLAAGNDGLLFDTITRGRHIGTGIIFQNIGNSGISS
jgi:hypothetical protein